MNTKNSFTGLSMAIRSFFTKYLKDIKNTSLHTISSYRDTLKLLCLYLAGSHRAVVRLSLDDITPERIIEFLTYLEETRNNSVATRNVRLAAIHSFFRYVASISPENLAKCQQILNIPFKRARTREVEYFEFEEVSAILEKVNRSTPQGARDYSLMLLMFNTGARAQEIVNLRVCDLHLSAPFSVHIVGKGNKERTCPIWANTARILNQYIDLRGVAPTEKKALFINQLGTPLTRFGIRYVLKKYTELAAEGHPRLRKKRLHPHSMRHSTAIHLLKSGVDLCSIASWLGHASPNTTNRYATMDLDMKRKIIAKIESPSKKALLHIDPDLMTWLENL